MQTRTKDRPKLQGFRFAPRVNDTMDWLTDRLSMSRTDVISLAIRRLAQVEGMPEEILAQENNPKTTGKMAISKKSRK